MTKLRVGELCAGYGGLGMAVEAAFDAELTWVSEYEDAPSRILAHHWPDVPNYGDMTKIDWAAIEPVDIISGGTPCQDLSAAGRRKGMTDGTRSNLWVQMREAIATIQPRYVVWENVRGAYSAGADSDVESCPGCVGEAGDGQHFLRALGRVLGDLSDLGYDCEWRGIRASDVGAPHARFRVFVLGTLRDSHSQDVEGQRAGGVEVSRVAVESRQRGSASLDPADAHSLGLQRPGDSRDRGNGPTHDGIHAAAISQGFGGREGRAEHARLEGRPDAQFSSDASTPNDSSAERRGTESNHLGTGQESTSEPGEHLGHDSAADAAGDEGRVGNGDDVSLRRRTLGLRPGAGRGSTPDADDVLHGIDNGGMEGQAASGERRDEGRGGGSAPRGRGSAQSTNWGQYEPAIRRWEAVIGRPSPAPTEPTGRDGGHRLSARFTEWMMGLPDGWICDVPGVSRNDQLKAAGNGVVPQQAYAALVDMLGGQG